MLKGHLPRVIYHQVNNVSEDKTVNNIRDKSEGVPTWLRFMKTASCLPLTPTSEVLLLFFITLKPRIE